MGESKRRRERLARNRLTREVTERLVDDGRIIEAGWRAALLILGWGARPAPERRDLRLAYLSGAQHLWASVMGVLEEGREPTERDLARMSLIADELDGFAREMTRILGEPPAGQA
jgi:hypothetical protein